MIPDSNIMPKLRCRRPYKNNSKYEPTNNNLLGILRTSFDISNGNYIYEDPVTRYIDLVFRSYFGIELEKYLCDNFLTTSNIDNLHILSSSISMFYCIDIITTNNTIINRMKKGIKI